MAWPTDSWICRAICSAPRMSVVSPAGHGGADEQGPRLVGDTRRVGLDVDLVDHLPAPRAVLPAGGRVRAALRLAVADRRGHDPGPALPDALVDAVALAGHEPLGGVPDLVHRLGDVGTVLGHRRRRPHEHVALGGERDAERVDRGSRWPTSRRPPVRRHETGRGRATPARSTRRSPRPGRRPHGPRRRTGRARRRSPSPSRRARGRRCPTSRPGRGPRRRRCGRSSTRSGGASPGRRRTPRRRRAPPAPPRRGVELTHGPANLRQPRSMSLREPCPDAGPPSEASSLRLRRHGQRRAIGKQRSASVPSA